jgi:hypothetical protein
MADKTFSAGIKRYAEATKAQMRAILQDSLFDVLEAAQTPQPGVEATGGSFEVGKIPVVSSDLIRSLVSELNGTGFGAAAEMSYELVIAGMDLGDTAKFAWTSDHARPIEYGWTTSTGHEVGGRHYVGANAERWETIVAENARRIIK